MEKVMKVMNVNTVLRDKVIRILATDRVYLTTKGHELLGLYIGKVVRNTRDENKDEITGLMVASEFDRFVINKNMTNIFEKIET